MRVGGLSRLSVWISSVSQSSGVSASRHSLVVSPLLALGLGTVKRWWFDLAPRRDPLPVATFAGQVPRLPDGSLRITPTLSYRDGDSWMIPGSLP